MVGYIATMLEPLLRSDAAYFGRIQVRRAMLISRVGNLYTWSKKHRKKLSDTLILLTEAAGAVFLALSVIPNPDFTTNDIPVANIIEWKFDIGIRLIIAGYLFHIFMIWLIGT